MRVVAPLALVATLIGACSSQAPPDPAFSGAYPCAQPCASDQFCFLDTPGVDSGVPLVGSCVPVGSCTDASRCDCLLQLVPTSCGTPLRECGVTPSGYVVECHEA